VFVDTNVFLYAVDPAEPLKQVRAIEVLGSLAAERIVISSQVLGEYYVTATRKLSPPIDPVEARRHVAGFVKFEVVAVDDALVQRAVHRSQMSTISYWDALIVEAARAGGCTELLTEDLAAGANFDGVTVVNPFA
jgi:predicted nucleic acid-binding protein